MIELACIDRPCLGRVEETTTEYRLGTYFGVLNWIFGQPSTFAGSVNSVVTDFAAVFGAPPAGTFADRKGLN